MAKRRKKQQPMPVFVIMLTSLGSASIAIGLVLKFI